MHLTLGYDLIARNLNQKKDTELAGYYKKQLAEAQQKLRGDAENEMHCLVAWRMRAIEDNFYSGSKVYYLLDEFELEDIIF